MPPLEAWPMPDMNQTARTSIIIPAHNSAASVGAAIESALAQTRAPLEIIVIDDGSTDDTAAVIASYGAPVVALSQANAGQGAARNAGLEVARGEFVAFLDADDYFLPTFIAKMEDFLDRNPAAVAASSAFLIQRAAGDYHGPVHYRELHDEHPAGLVLDNFFEFWGQYDHVRTGTVLVRSSVLAEIGLQNPLLRISQDLEYWALIGTAGPWGLLPEVLWINTSDAVARASGVRRKYAARRKRTPSVAEWQRRVLPRLTAEQEAGFAKVRGRVAAGYMVANALGGSRRAAGELVDVYGDAMPAGGTVTLLQRARRLGPVAWYLAIEALRLRDRLK